MWGEYDIIGFGWMCKVLGGKYREPDGVPIVRIIMQLGDIAEVIYRELELGVRNPEGVWDWIGKKRRELRTLGMSN